MGVIKMSRTYKSDLREKQANATREQIITAAHTILQTVRAPDMSYKAVAEEAGVSVRTVYRHFPEMNDLMLGVSDLFMSRYMPKNLDFSNFTMEDGIDVIHKQWSLMENDPALFRVLFSIKTRSRMDGPAVIRRMHSPWLSNLNDEQIKYVVAALELLISPYAWDVFNEYDLTADQALRLSEVASYALREHINKHPEHLDLNHPSPLRSEPPNGNDNDS